MRTWHRTVGPDGGDSSATPLLLLHGGPGASSASMRPLEGLAAAGRRVIRYDQLGCGRSDRPHDSSLWTIETFVEELAEIRRQLGLEEVHLLGWSWGGMLALEYLRTGPAGVRSLTLASAPVSIPHWLAEADRLRSELPAWVQRALDRCERSLRARRPQTGGSVHPGLSADEIERQAAKLEKQMAMVARPAVIRVAAAATRLPIGRRTLYDIVAIPFVQRHVHRGEVIPRSVFEMLVGVGKDVYETMWGPSEFHATGSLREWDSTPWLHEITVPTLITSGRYDEATPAQMEVACDLIPDARWVVFEESAHSAIVEESDRYREVLAAFLDEIERAQ